MTPTADLTQWGCCVCRVGAGTYTVHILRWRYIMCRDCARNDVVVSNRSGLTVTGLTVTGPSGCAHARPCRNARNLRPSW